MNTSIFSHMSLRKAAIGVSSGFAAVSAWLLAPMLAVAQTAGGSSGSYCATAPDTIIGGAKRFADVVKFVACFLQRTIVPFLFALAVGAFVFGMVKFIGTEDSSEREQGRQFMLWSVVGLAVMFSVWGLVSLLGDTIGVRNVIPQLPVD